MSNLLKNLLIALAFAVILWIGYTVFIANDQPEGMSATSAGDVSAEALFKSQELLTKLNELNAYDVSDSVFKDTSFVSLVDLRVDLGNEPSGRPNPFAPLE